MNKIKEAIGNTIVWLENFGVPRTLQAILLIGLVQGIVFTFIVPPWWHNDEPPHFEYAWLLANRPELAQTAETDLRMRRDLAMSMLQHGYYDYYRLPPDFTTNRPIYIGASQADDPPLYYWVVSLPLRLLKNTSYEIQNYAGRLISVLIFLATLYVVWKALGELSGEGHPLQWLTTIFIALLPGLTDTMTSISNDAGAVLVFSIFLWIGISALNHGLTWKRLLGLFVILVLGYFTKNTTIPAIPLIFFVLLFAVFRNRPQWLPVTITGAVIVLAALFSIRWGDPSFWYRVSNQPQPTRVKTAKAPFGEYAFRVEPGGFVGQFLSAPLVRPLRNKTVTIGAWMWADQPATAIAPKLSYYISSEAVMLFSESKTVELSTTPTFVSYTTNLPSDTERAWLTLCSANVTNYHCSTNATANNYSASGTIYYDGIVLIPQEFNKGEPSFLNGDTLSGSWNGMKFENKARNNSAENGSFWLNPEISDLVLKASNLFSGINIFVASIQDWQGAGWYYKSAAQTLFITFWSNPARAKVFLLGGNLTYDIIRAFTTIGLLGLIPFSWKKRKALRWDLIVFIGFAFAVVWGLTFVRGAVELLRDVPLIPWARYAFPVILPTAFLFCAGWLEILQWIENRFHLTRMQSTSLFLAALVGIDLLTVISILDFFYWKDQQAYVALFLFTLIAMFICINNVREKLKPQ